MADLPPGALAPFVHTFRVVGGVDGPRRFVDARVASAAYAARSCGIYSWPPAGASGT